MGEENEEHTSDHTGKGNDPTWTGFGHKHTYQHYDVIPFHQFASVRAYCNAFHSCQGTCGPIDDIDRANGMSGRCGEGGVL
jgi:hypothetical protein